MKNPYQVLDIPQDASKSEITRAVMVAMRNRNYSLQEIQHAQRQLLNPEKRLVADFLFPAKVKSRRLKEIDIKIQIEGNTLISLDTNAFDSLK